MWSSLQRVSTRAVGSGWTGLPLLGTPGCRASWDTGLELGAMELGLGGWVGRIGLGRMTEALTTT